MKKMRTVLDPTSKSPKPTGNALRESRYQAANCRLSGWNMKHSGASEMAKTDEAGFHLARITTDDCALWVVATPRNQVDFDVLNLVPEGWTAALLPNRLTSQEIEVLNLKQGEVREITKIASIDGTGSPFPLRKH